MGMRDLEYRLFVLKLTSTSTQSSVFEKLQMFCKSDTHEVMLVVVSMQQFTLQVVNHLRIMIEEAEFQFSSPTKTPKLFVLLLHFPPEMFFNHCYPSLFLSGWDHYYLDTIAPSERKGVIDISQWFSHCCIRDKMCSSFLDKPLREIMVEAIPILATQFSVMEMVQPTGSNIHFVHVGNNREKLKKVLLDTNLGEILQKQFLSYWQTTEMTKFSEQAANFPHMYESTLSITDAIHTIVRSSFYDFLFYMLSVMKKQHALKPLLTSCGTQHSYAKLSLDLIGIYPKPPTLSHLKVASMSEIQKAHTEEKHFAPTNFPFFYFVCNVLEVFLDQCMKEVKAMQEVSVNELDPQPGMQHQHDFNEELVRNLVCDEAEKKLREATTKVAEVNGPSVPQIDQVLFLDAAINAMNDSEIWKGYFEDFMAKKLHLDPKSNSPSMQVLHELFADFSGLDIHRRVIEVHAFIRFSQLDSKLLTLLRFIDSLHQDFDMMSHRPGETNVAETISKPNILSELVIDSLYQSVKRCQVGYATSADELHKMSRYYYTLVSNQLINLLLCTKRLHCH